MSRRIASGAQHAQNLGALRLVAVDKYAENECRPTHRDALRLTEVRKNRPRADHLRVSLTSAAFYAGRA